MGAEDGTGAQIDPQPRPGEEKGVEGLINGLRPIPGAKSQIATRPELDLPSP